MKNLVLLFLMFISNYSISQYRLDNYEDLDINLNLNMIENNSSYPKYSNSNNSGSIGLGLISGGVLFATAGLLTVPDYEVMPDGTTKTKPFFKQGARMLAITTGGACFLTGIVVSIGGR
jgi:hypothetical protein